MNIKQIAVSFGRTQNTGNFNSLRADVTLTADLEDGDVWQDCMEILREDMAEVVSIIREAKETYVQDWLGAAR